MTKFKIGTNLIIVAALIAIVVAIADLPKFLLVIVIGLALLGFVLQMVAAWQNRPSVMLSKRPSLKEAMRRHHDHYVGLERKGLLKQIDRPQYELAVRREENGKVDPLPPKDEVS